MHECVSSISVVAEVVVVELMLKYEAAKNLKSDSSFNKLFCIFFLQYNENMTTYNSDNLCSRNDHMR